jgi:hypothetical protein
LAHRLLGDSLAHGTPVRASEPKSVIGRPSPWLRSAGYAHFWPTVISASEPSLVG